jgi:hypothetical protein
MTRQLDANMWAPLANGLAIWLHLFPLLCPISPFSYRIAASFATICPYLLWEVINACAIMHNKIVASDHDDHQVFDQQWDYKGPLGEPNLGVLAKFVGLLAMHQ